MPARVTTRAKRAIRRIDNMIREQKQHTGKRPTVVRVRMADYLALVECEYLKDDRIAALDIEVKAA